MSRRSEQPAVEVDCQLCPWQSRWPDVALARAAGAWHAYDAHPGTWRAVVGERPPHELRPQRPPLADAAEPLPQRRPWGGPRGLDPRPDAV